MREGLERDQRGREEKEFGGELSREEEGDFDSKYLVLILYYSYLFILLPRGTNL